MNSHLLRPVQPLTALVVLLAAAAPFSRSVLAQCCGSRSASGSSGDSATLSHGTLQSMFGGGSSRVLSLHNKSSAPVVYRSGGNSVEIPAGTQKRVDTGGVNAENGAVPPLPGETSLATVDQKDGSETNPGATPTLEEKEEDTCPVVYDSSDNSGWAPAEKTTPIPVPPVGAPPNAGPPKQFPARVAGDPNTTPAQTDTKDVGHGGGALSPGGVSQVPYTDPITQVTSLVPHVTKPGPLIAASLGPAYGGTSRLGFIVPATPLPATIYNFEQRTSYIIRGVDLEATTYTGASVTRFRSVNGLAELTQTDANTLTLKFYDFDFFTDDLDASYVPTGAAFRTI